MEAITQAAYFNSCPTVPYKIVSVMDGNKAFTLQEGTGKLVIDEYKGKPSQLFHVYNNNLKYALVNFQANLALHVEGESKNDGGVIKADPGQFQSSYFEIEPVTQGQWAGKACFLKTFAGRALDIKGGKCNAGTDICQWSFNGNANQTWVITPADHLPQIKADQFPQVAPHFSPKPKTTYKVVSVLDHTKALTVDKKSNELTIQPYSGDFFQKFFLVEEHHKVALTLPVNKNALCVFGDKKDNGAKVVADPGKHHSSWFEVVRTEKGQFAHRAYVIKTHAGNMALDISEGKAVDGKPVVQYKIHENPNQLWLFVPVENEKVTEKNAKVAAKAAKQAAKEDKATDVPANFKFHNKSHYKIVSHMDENYALTYDGESGKLIVSEYDDDSSQKFEVHVDKSGKITFIVLSSQDTLSVVGDKKDNSAHIVADREKKASSVFEVVRAEKGDCAHKAYLIKTHAGKALDINGGKCEEGKAVIQYDIHERANQLWHFEEVVEPDVAPNFKPNPNKLYRIFSVMDRKLSLTIDPQSHRLSVQNFNGDYNQKFTIHTQNKKFAFLFDNQQALCVQGDSQNNDAPIVTDPGKHHSSWFDVVRADKGNWAKKAYKIKTHAQGKALDLAGGQPVAGKPVIQWQEHDNENQLWLFEVVAKEAKTLGKVASKPKPEPKNFSWKQNFDFVPAFIQNIEGGVSRPNLFSPNQHYIIYAINDNTKALDVSKGKQDEGCLIVYSFHGAPNQRFTFEQEGNQYRIKNVESGKYVTIQEDDSHDHAFAKVQNKGHKTEIWNILPAAEHQYKGKNAYNIRSIFGKALEAPNGNFSNSTKIQQNAFKGGDAQTWLIKEI